MKFSKARHFWTWFQKNRNTYLELPTKTKEEAIYYMRELVTHLIVYGTARIIYHCHQWPRLPGRPRLLKTTAVPANKH
jgi:hypothetical protein